MRSNPAVNGGSSSIKLELYQVGEPLKRGPNGTIDRIGPRGTHLVHGDTIGNKKAGIVPVWLSQDANSLMSVVDHRLRSRHHIDKHGEDLPEIRTWEWTSPG